jgi:DNA invertase Pin-like site-specific DNA recombinase
VNINQKTKPKGGKPKMSTAMQKMLQEYGIKFIINYLRKSRQDEEREKKTGEDTLHEQKQLMDRVLSSYGVPYDQKPEIGSGDKIATRPVFQSVIKDIEDGKYDAIAVKEISRMGRGSYKDMGMIYDLIQEKRIYIITPWKIYDPTNPSDLRQIRFELFLSREEFETIRERLTGGRYNAAMEGKWVAGRAPYGYEYNEKTKKLEIKEDQAEIIRAIYDFYANGIIQNNGKRKLVQFRALASYLKRLGIKTPKGKEDWAPTYLKDFLMRDRYIGRIRFRTTQRTADGKVIPRPESEHIIVEDSHAPIIDMETWEKVQARIEGRDTTTRTKLDFDPCELAGVCVCKVCGHKMLRQYSVQNYKKQDGTVTQYHKEFLWCHSTGCTFVKYRNIEADLLETLKYLQNLDDNMLQSNLQAILSEKSKEVTTTEDLKKHVEMRKEDLKRRLNFIFDKFESGIYSDEIFLQRKAEIEKELNELKNVQFEEIEEADEGNFNPELVRRNITSILEAYQNASHKSDRNKILRSVFDHVVVEVIEKGRGRREAKHVIYPVLKYNLVAKSR